MDKTLNLEKEDFEVIVKALMLLPAGESYSLLKRIDDFQRQLREDATSSQSSRSEEHTSELQ